MKRPIICTLVCILVLFNGCNSNMNTTQENYEEKKEKEKLVVWVSGVSHYFASDKDGNGIAENDIAYPSKYTIGSRLIGGELECINGNVFACAISEYAEKTGIEIEIQYLEDYYGQSNKLQELYDNGGQLPDLVVVGKKWGFDYFRLAEQDMLLDFLPYMLEEGSMNEEQYYREVLEGGKIKGQQYVMPILFNMNAAITSQRYLQYIGIEENAGATYEEIMYMLKRSCMATSSSDTMEAIYEASGNMIGGQFLPSILFSAAYVNYNDEEENLIIEENIICSVLELMDLYMEQELVQVPEWEGNTYLDNLNHPNIKSRYYQGLTADAHEGIGIFLTGGRSGGMNFHSSLLTDAAYFNSVYNDNDEKLVLCGIPTLEDSGCYTANISLFAFGFKDTNRPQEVYKLVKYLMDYKYPVGYGFSVNKENTEEQLTEIGKTTMEIFPDDIWSGVYGGFNKLSELQIQIEKIHPLNEEYIDIIRNMLDNICGGGLPFSYLEHNLTWNALNMYMNGEMSKEETARWVIQKLKSYLKEREKIEPFYDPIYDCVYENIDKQKKEINDEKE